MSIEVDSIIEDVIAQAQGQRKAHSALYAAYKRDLNEADLQALTSSKGGPTQVSPVLRIRHSHHAIARLLAEGRRPQEVSYITGYSPGRISVLQSDPAFAELVSYYASNTEAIYFSVHERLAALGLHSIEELAERLDSDPSSFKNRELMELAALVFDRAGYGTTSKIQHTHTFSEEALAKIKHAAEAARKGEVRTLELLPSSKSDPGPDLG